MNTVIYRIGKVTLSQNVPVNITKKWISEIFHVRKLYVALYSPKRTEMGVLVVSGRRLNRLIGRIHSNQTFHKQAQSSSIRGTILQRTFYSLNLNQTHIHKEPTVARHLYPLQLPLNLANSLKRWNTFSCTLETKSTHSLERAYIFGRAKS